MTCAVADCTRSVEARGWCGSHYARWRRYGDPLAGRLHTIREQFWTHVTKDEGCWLWTAGRDVHGYGQLTGSVDGKRKTLKAHRVAWELTHGPIPERLCVLHHCDNPPCCNPEHLWLGTPADNSRDMVRKGRSHHKPNWQRWHDCRRDEKGHLIVSEG